VLVGMYEHATLRVRRNQDLGRLSRRRVRAGGVRSRSSRAP